MIMEASIEEFNLFKICKIMLFFQCKPLVDMEVFVCNV
jgi:hypothetical protein